jgi:hypothetical protein
MTAEQPPMGMPSSTPPLQAGSEPANLGDILERVLDRGIVIAGDIKVSLLDIELLTLKLRLVIASVDTARQVGIDWWEHDPWLSSHARQAVEPGPVESGQVESGLAESGPIESGPSRPEAIARPRRRQVEGRRRRKEGDEYD